MEDFDPDKVRFSTQDAFDKSLTQTLISKAFVYMLAAKQHATKYAVRYKVKKGKPLSVRDGDEICGMIAQPINTRVSLSYGSVPLGCYTCANFPDIKTMFCVDLLTITPLDNIEELTFVWRLYNTETRDKLFDECRKNGYQLVDMVNGFMYGRGQLKRAYITERDVEPIDLSKDRQDIASSLADIAATLKDMFDLMMVEKVGKQLEKGTE